MTSLRRGRWPLALAALAAPLALGGCGDPRYWVCAEADPARTSALPGRLSQTGLFADLGADTLAPDVLAYRPQFELWSDGATKRRWVWLPPGARIDTSDMNEWRLPEGAKLWKEFSRDGVRVETRLLEKRGPSDRDWVALSYLWRADGSDAIAAPWGALDALGTPHDVPSAGECAACHGGRASFVLGFSALQLSAPAAPGFVDLEGLVRAGLLSAPPAGRLEVPGDETERAALGYLHANCSHCHNQRRPASDGPRCFDPRNELDFSLSADALGETVETATYRTALSGAIKPGNPGDSRLIELISHRGFFVQMPPLATEQVDDGALQLLRAWVEGL